MRKKAIKILYKFKFLLKLFHIIVGKSKFKIASKNLINTNTANIYHCKFNIIGKNNKIIIGDNTDLTNCCISVKGNNNTILIGNDSFVNEVKLIAEGDNCSIEAGSNFFVYGNTRIYVADGAKFIAGDSCMLSDNIEIRATDNHSIIDINSGKRINYEEDIVLHDKVWIGMGVTILKGSEINEGCIVGAGSVVTKKFNLKNSIIAGNPSHIIKTNVKWLMERI